MLRWIWLLVLGLFVTLWWVGHGNSAPMAATLSSGSGSVVCPMPPVFHLQSAEPMQSEVAGKMAAFRVGEATVSPLAGFSVQARVLSREDYSLGREADYSPTDLALGWGPMAEPGMAEKLNIRQGGRFYRYEWGNDGPPIAPEQIIRNSANMHMVPADRNVAQALDRIHAGDAVRVSGWLIRIDRDDGWRWQSSLSRDDSGPGACELVLVCSIEPR
ncbi:MAG: hypothetical protein WC213_02700 [Arenimonas sp.]|jgi:hypothetical protein